MARVKLALAITCYLLLSSVLATWQFVTICKKGYVTPYGCLYIPTTYKVLQTEVNNACSQAGMSVFTIQINPSLVNWSDMISVDPFNQHTPLWIEYGKYWYLIYANGTAVNETGKAVYGYPLCVEEYSINSTLPHSFRDVTNTVWNYFYSVFGDSLVAIVTAGFGGAAFFIGGAIAAQVVALLTLIAFLLAAQLHLITLSPMMIYGIKVVSLLMALSLALEWYVLRRD